MSIQRTCLVMSQMCDTTLAAPLAHLPRYVNFSIIQQRNFELDKIICLVFFVAFTIEANIRKLLKEKY